jgi:DNA replication protein DnaC
MSTFAGGWKDPAKVREFENEIMKADILVIDDLGKEFKNRLVESVFDKVIRYRETPTIVTSNITLHEIANVYGESIYSLFYSRFGHIKMVGHDYRKSLDLKEKLIKPKGYQPIK